ncbi:MAG: ImmA/IrrE family metallo-endopeptidase [Halanaerobiales bacterium]
MTLLEQTIKNKSPVLYNEIQKEVLFFQKKYVGARDSVLQDDIFRLIDDLEGVDLLIFPIEDDELCGFLCEYKGQMFIYINSYLPYDKQIFAAAHELYHYLEKHNRELLRPKSLEENNVDRAENKANLFAALLLVPEESLMKELSLLNVKSGRDLDELKIIKLMDTFAVPLKTIILRLYEIDILSEYEAKRWLTVPDRDSEKGILKQIKKHKIAERWQKRTRQIKYSNLKFLIIDNDELELLSRQKIEKDLAFIKQDDGNE